MRVVAIQINVHTAGENPINTTRTLPIPVDVRPAYAFYGWSPYVATFCKSSIPLDEYYCSREKYSRLYLLSRLGGPRDPPQFLSQPNQ
jgi:hypothetical protein